jgi:hypothetical protein
VVLFSDNTRRTKEPKIWKKVGPLRELNSGPDLLTIMVKIYTMTDGKFMIGSEGGRVVGASMYETHLLYARLSRNPETGIIPLDQADNARSNAEKWSMITEHTSAAQKRQTNEEANDCES